MRRVLIAQVLVSCVLLASAHAAPVVTTRGVAATASADASRAAVQMLDRGGNAFDAAVAAALALGVVQPYGSGLGGGGFLVGHVARGGRTVALDFRETAPAAATRDMYLGPDGQPVPERSRDGALSVAIPGAPAGYFEIHRRWGKLPLGVVAEPAARLAELGFSVTPQYRRLAEPRLACLRADPAAASTFLRRATSGSWELPPLGTRIVQKDLARTLRAFGKRGAAAVYTGPVARAIVETVRQGGGVLTLADLEGYRVRERAPLEGSYRGRRVATMPLPSAGGVTVLQMLNVLELEDLAAAWRLPAHVHVFAEAARQSYADRAALLGDPDFVEAPVGRLVSKDYAKRLYALVAGKPARPAAGVAPLPAESDHTTHLSIVDAEGNAVSMTATLNYMFGSCVVAAGTGILLNDEMDDFAAKPGAPNAYGLVTGETNAVAPGKVPLSSMAPTLVFAKDRPDRLELVVGSPGGPTIPTTVVQVIVNALDYRMRIDRAIATPRVHHQYAPDALLVEPQAFEAATAEALRGMGYRLEGRPVWGDAHAIWIDPNDGLRYGASDLRGEGAAVAQ